MKNTVESDAKVSALESGAFVPSAEELAESLPFQAPSGVAGDLFRMFADAESQRQFEYGFNVLYPMMRDNGEI